MNKTMNKSKKELSSRQRFSELKQRLLNEEKALKKERHHLWLMEKELSQEETVWDRLELLSTDILGYVSQIASRGYTSQNPLEVIAHLHKLNLFEIDCITDWYYTESEEYPKLKKYFELLDYVRLLTLEYVDQFLLLQAS
jgi:hypothetical protein